MWRRGIGHSARKAGGIAAFAGGILAVFLALESPVDYAAEHLFMAHQVQHHAAAHDRADADRVVGAAGDDDQRAAASGLRRGGLTPFFGNGVLRRVFSMADRPGGADHFVSRRTLVWELPAYHDAALLNDNLHDTMHVTMLIAGLLFWWRIFDTRPAPAGLGYGTRLMMLWSSCCRISGLAPTPRSRA